MATSQYSAFSTPRPNRPILPRTLRRLEAGWDSTMFSTNLVAFHVPNNDPVRWVHVPVVHFNVDDGKTMVIWRKYWEDRAQTAYVTLPNGRRFLVLSPYDRTSYQVSQAVEEKFGFRWCGELLIFACGVHTGLLVNMRTWQEDRARAWEVVRRYIVGDIDGDTIVESELPWESPDVDLPSPSDSESDEDETRRDPRRRDLSV